MNIGKMIWKGEKPMDLVASIMGALIYIAVGILIGTMV